MPCLCAQNRGVSALEFRELRIYYYNAYLFSVVFIKVVMNTAS